MAFSRRAAVPSDERDARVRLEGRAELLEATRLRYAALGRQLEGFRWQNALRRTTDVLRVVIASESEVVAALRLAARHAERDSWPPDGVLRRCLNEVTAQRQKLEWLTAKRLGPGEPAAELGLGQRLERLLERDVLNAGRAVPVGQRRAFAEQVLLWPSADLQPVAEFGRLVELVVGRPAGQTAPKLLFTLSDFDAMVTAWNPGLAALSAVWQRLDRVDGRGALTRYVQSRARRPPKGPPKTGVDVVVRAEFWRTLANARFESIWEREVSPLVARSDAERFAVVRWVWQLEHESAPGAEPSVVSPARAALLALARGVAGLTPSSRNQRSWPALEAWASRADAARDDDWERLRDSLTVLVRVLNVSEARETPPLYRSLGRTAEKRSVAARADSLVGLVSTLHALR